MPANRDALIVEVTRVRVRVPQPRKFEKNVDAYIGGVQLFFHLRKIT